jgi:bifunctional DNA primase/polymerase-like protein/AAA domain-containing protein
MIAIDLDINNIDSVTAAMHQVPSQVPEPGVLSHAKAAIDKGFHVFPLTPKAKVTLPGSHGFKDSKPPSDPSALVPWNQDPSRNIGIDLGASDLCVLDFDDPDGVPAWISAIRTYKVRTARGVHVYFRGARPTTGLFVDGAKVGDIKSMGGYVLAEGSVHPDGPIYTVIDDSEIVPLPDISSLVRRDKERVIASADGDPIPHGSHDTELTRIAGVLRNAGFTPAKIEEHLIDVCEQRCVGYGGDYREMCSKIAHSIGKKPVGHVGPIPVLGGGVGGGEAKTDVSNWRSQFRNLSQMEQGPITKVIDGVLQEGTCFLGATAGHGKTLVALAIAKAITLGEPLFGIPEYITKVPRNVIYLIPESGDKAFRTRGEAFRLPPDDRFIARTISSGASLALSDPYLMEAVRQQHPVIILDTASRFIHGNDENSAAENRLLVNDILALRAAGAVLVIILHHAKKSTTENRETMTLENMLRGTSDFGAMCDQAYGIRLDVHLYNRGAGPMELELVNLKDRERLGGLTTIRLAATYKKPGVLFPVSYIDQTGNFHPVDFRETKDRTRETLNQLVESDPMMSVEDLCEVTGLKPFRVQQMLKGLGWHVAKGGSDGRSPWHKDEGKPCPYEAKGKAKRGAVDLDPPVEFKRAA